MRADFYPAGCKESAHGLRAHYLRFAALVLDFILTARFPGETLPENRVSDQGTHFIYR